MSTAYWESKTNIDRNTKETNLTIQFQFSKQRQKLGSLSHGPKVTSQLVSEQELGIHRNRKSNKEYFLCAISISKFEGLPARCYCTAPTFLSFAQNQPQKCAQHDPEPKRNQNQGNKNIQVYSSLHKSRKQTIPHQESVQ